MLSKFTEEVSAYLINCMLELSTFALQRGGREERPSETPAVWGSIFFF